MQPVTFGPEAARALMQALLQVELPQAQLPTLMALLGSEVGAVFEGQGEGGARLRLDTGQVLVAEGELPFPEGTALKLRVGAAPEGVGLRLETLEARPPALPALLAPLVQGEAEALGARLAQAEPLPELEPLLRLLRVLGDPAPALPTPTVDRVAERLPMLAPDLQRALAEALELPTEAEVPELARALVRWLAVPERAGEAAGQETGQEALLLRALRGGWPAPAHQLLGRIQARGALAPAQVDALAAWLRGVLGAASALPEHAPVFREALPLPQGLLAAPSGREASPADRAEGWEAWIRAGTETLADPRISPREAPFHVLQAREGTAFFELPLPWAGAGSLQLWVEEDASREARSGAEDPARRVLLGVRFSRLGETRVGLASTPGHLRVRIWTEHPELREAEEERLREELEAGGTRVELHVQALGEPATAPSLRALATGNRLHALG